MMVVVEPERLAEGAWALLGGGGNSLVVRDGSYALAVDVKMGEAAEKQRRIIQADLGLTLRRILLTHSHPDHSDGLDLYPDVATVLAHPRTRDRIAEAIRQQRRQLQPPWALVRSDVRLKVGGEEVWIRHLGKGHTDGDLIAHVPGLRLVATGDLFLAGFEPYADPDAGGDLMALGRTLGRVLELDFDRVLPGHGPVVEREALARTRDYLARMEAGVRRAVREGASEEAAVAAVSAQLVGVRLDPVPFRADRAGNIRTMYRRVREDGKTAAP
jgi:glyoxylase-like metal-dependent hydrolase (beta-lactamase superfamily II)